MKKLQLSCLFLLLASTVNANASTELKLELETESPYIEWSELSATTWVPNANDDVYTLTLKGEAIFAFEWHSSINAQETPGVYATLRACINQKSCTTAILPTEKIYYGTYGDSIESKNLGLGVNEYSYTLTIFKNGEVLDTDTLTYYISRY